MAVLLNAIILTVHYGIVPKWHLYLSQFIILFQPCKAVLQITSSGTKSIHPPFSKMMIMDPLPFPSFFPQMIIFCLPIKTNHSSWVNKILQGCNMQDDTVWVFSFHIFAIALCRRFHAPCLIFVCKPSYWILTHVTLMQLWQYNTIFLLQQILLTFFSYYFLN